MKKRISARVICLLVAAVMLIGALTVSAINGSPYENLKNAALNALFYENVSFEGEFTLHVDGQLHDRASIRGYVGDESMLTIGYYESPWQLELEDADAAFRIPARAGFTNFVCQYFSVSSVDVGEMNHHWYSVRRQSGNFTLPQSLGHEIFGIAGRDSNHLRLAEMAVDVFIGDLKNNLAMNSQGDGTRRITGAITESQLPEVIRVLIDIAVDEQLRWSDDTRQREDFEHVLSVPVRSLAIDRIQGYADIDSDGNLLYLNVLGVATIENIFGDTHVVEARGVIRFFDIGTTVPVGPFVDAAEIFEEAFRTLQEDRRQLTIPPRSFLFFALDADGNIDPGSFTPGFPNVQDLADLFAAVMP